MILGYVTWGDSTDIYSESVFSILTYLSDADVDEVCVVTERPECYRALGDRVNVVHCPPDQMREWAGEVIPCKLKSPRASVRPYSFRHKIKAVERIVELHPGRDVLYLDSDTFRGRPLRAVRDILERGASCMHAVCGLLHRAHSRVNQEAWSVFRGKTFAGYAVDENSRWFNSGAVGIPGARAAEIIRSVVAINDEIYALTGFYNAEELAFSFGLGLHTEVVDVGDVVGHYWGNDRQWADMIVRFLARCHLEDLPLEERVRRAGEIDFAALPLYIHHPTRRKQILRFADKYFPLKRPRYFPEKPDEW